MLLFTILSFVAIVTTGSSAQQCERCSPVCGRSNIVTLTCQSPFAPMRCSTLNAWKVNNTVLNRNSSLYNITNTCNGSHITSTVMFLMEEDTYGYYDCVDTGSLTFSIFYFNQSCCDPISIGVGCTLPMRPSATGFMQSSAASTISAALKFTSLSISTTSLAPTPSSPPEPFFVIPSKILYAAIACVALVVVLLVLVSILVCTVQCWKKRLSKRITSDKHESFAEKSPPGDIIETEIKSTSLSNGSRTINISSPVPDPSRLHSSSPQTIVISPPAAPSTPPTPQGIGLSHPTSPAAAKGYNKLFVTPQNPELLTRSPSPEALHVYSQLNHVPEESTTRVPVPVVPPKIPPLNNSPNQCMQDSVAAKEHLYFMLDTPEQLQENFNPSTDSAASEGHIYQVLETFDKSSRLGNETSPINRTNTLLPPPPLHTSNDYAEINVCVVSQENRDLPPPPPRQPPPSSKPPLIGPSPLSRPPPPSQPPPPPSCPPPPSHPPPPPSCPPPPSHPPLPPSCPPPPSHPPPPPSCPPPPSHPPPPPSCPPPPSHPPPPPSCPPPPSHPPPPPSCPPPPSHPPPPPSCPPPPSHPPPPPSCPPPLPSRPPPSSHPPPPSISPPIQSTIPHHRPTDYEDISKTQTLPKKPTNSSKKLPPAEYEIPLSKTLPRRPKPPRHDPNEYEDVEEDEPSTFVRGFSLSTAQPQPFVANVQQRSFRRLQPPKQLTLSYDRLPMQVDMKSEESPPGSNLQRHNSQKVKMKIRHNDRIKITTSPQRPTIAPPHFVKSPSQSPQNGNNELLLVLNDVPLHEAEYDRLRLKH